MHRYIAACADHSSSRKMQSLLASLVAAPPQHAFFVNTLARLEYVGVRKMLKSRRAERMDLDGLQHVLDEGVHALRLKKAALALGAAAGVDVSTFADEHTLAGDAAERYFQTLDRSAEATVVDLDPGPRAEANYLLTSAAIEVRAHVFYPAYDRLLAAGRAGFSVAAITKDEDRHLAEMQASLERLIPDWRRRIEPVLEAELTLFEDLMVEMDMAFAVLRAA